MKTCYRLTRHHISDARYVGHLGSDADSAAEDVIMAMVGREITQFFPKRKVSIGEEIFKVEGLSQRAIPSTCRSPGAGRDPTGADRAGRTRCARPSTASATGQWARGADGEELHISNPAQAIVGIAFCRKKCRGGLCPGLGASPRTLLFPLSRSSAPWAGSTRKENMVTKGRQARGDLQGGERSTWQPLFPVRQPAEIIVAKILAAQMKIVILD